LAPEGSARTDAYGFGVGDLSETCRRPVGDRQGHEAEAKSDRTARSSRTRARNRHGEGAIPPRAEAAGLSGLFL